MATRRTILESLTRKDLLDLAKAVDVAGLTAQPKADIVAALACTRAFTTEDLLARFSRNQLKAACQAAGLPDHGREKQLLVDRLLGSNGQSSSPSRTTATPAAASQAHATARARLEKPMAKQRKSNGSTTVTNFRHKEAKRKNNPPAKLAAEGTVPAVPKAKYAYNPHLPPKLRFGPDGDYEPLLEKAQHQPLSAEEAQQLAQALEARQPWLEWAEKQEQDGRGQFEVDPVALHIHERVSAQAILKVAARQDAERSLFADPEQEYHEAVQFYRHDIDWSNRLILGDSMQVMSSLAHREDMAGKVQMIYIDPPYGIRFASNFQPEVSNRDVKDTEKDLTREPEMVKAYRDTWHLGIHSYLTYLRDRLIVAKELLADTGSVFVQMGDENLHHVRKLCDEIFGAPNFLSLISYVTTSGFQSATLSRAGDYLLWYCRDREQVKYHQIYSEKQAGEDYAAEYKWVRLPDGSTRPLTSDEYSGAQPLPDNARAFRYGPLTSSGWSETGSQPFEFEGERYSPSANNHWKVARHGLGRLAAANYLLSRGNSLAYYLYLDSYPVVPVNNLWLDTKWGFDAGSKAYVVQTNAKVIERCVLMTTDPGDLVLDPTCGSGTTAYVAEQWGRRWITVDTSRVSVALARQRLLTGKFDRYRLEDEDTVVNGNGRGIDPGHNFKYKTVPHITLGSIARNENLDPIFAKHEPVLDAKLDACNEALKGVTKAVRTKLEHKLLQKQKREGKRAVTDGDQRRWNLPDVTQGECFEHWTVPFDVDEEEWPFHLQNAVRDYRDAWRAKMDEVNQCIADNAEQETLVDQPEVVKGVVRVTGPFTVEAVQPPEMSLGDVATTTEGFAGEPEELEAFPEAERGYLAPMQLRDVEPRPDLDAQNVDAYLDQMVRLLKGDGVRFPNNKHMTFTRLERAEGTLGLHAEGRWVVADKDGKPAEEDADPDGRAFVAVAFGPQYGPVTAKMVEDCMRSANRMGYDELVVAGFSFDGPAQAVIEENPNPRLRIHQANIRPDVNPAMDGLLKEQAGSQLFTVFGQPRTELHGPEGDTGGGQYRVTMEGVDIFDPVENTVRSTGADKVAAWFLDSDYDGRTFCITQAFFPDRNAWDKLGKALKGVVDEEAFEKLSGTESLPFPKGKHGRAAVKVIDPRGNEVMRVHEVGV